MENNKYLLESIGKDLIKGMDPSFQPFKVPREELGNHILKSLSSEPLSDTDLKTIYDAKFEDISTELENWRQKNFIKSVKLTYTSRIAGYPIFAHIISKSGMDYLRQEKLID